MAATRVLDIGPYVAEILGFPASQGIARPEIIDVSMGIVNIK
jgi:hypothetical protein